MSSSDLRRPVSVDHSRLQGWLTLANAIETESLEQIEWQRRYCVLVKEERKLYFFNDTESVLALASPLSPARFKFTADDLDGQCMSSRKNALTLLDPNYSGFQRGTRTTRSFREKMKTSFQRSVKWNTGKDERPAGGSMRVARSRSFGKADRLEIPPDSFPSSRKLGASLDNLHRVGSSGTPETHSASLGEHGTFLDLASRGTLSIQLVHPSVSPKHSCFRIITDAEILYASCGSQEELNKWITSLNNCQRPNRNHLRHLDSQLSLWVLEARNLQPKKRYYCEIYLNGILHAQTCCKAMNDILFWGEPFVFEDLPPLGSVVIKIYRENYHKKKREMAPATDVGKVEIPAVLLDGGQLLEKWYPLVVYQGAGKGGSGAGRDKEKENLSLRLKVQYQVVSILPLKVYDDFLRFLKTDYGVICKVLEPAISAKAKDEIAQTFVRILQVGGNGKVKEFICDVIMAEVQHVENENLIFRGNTFATKAVDTYMKMVGEAYLRETLSNFIHTLVDTYAEEDYEVDPMKMQVGANLQANQQRLVMLVERAWCDILSSFNKFPTDLRKTLHSIRQRFSTEKEDACMKLISGSIFLRFFCPAILSPSLFRLCQEYPDERTARKLTLVAKVIQNLANFARFGVKEEYMCFMNDFVEKEIKNMKQYIDRISSPVADTEPVVGWGPCTIQIGREASIMHSILTSQLRTVQLTEEAIRRLEPLPSILDQITRAGEEEEGDPFSSTFEALRVMQSTIRDFNSEPPVSGSSSEYTTPVQSSPSSPTHESSPPLNASNTSTSQMSLGSLLTLNPPSEQQHGNGSPSTSPTHGGVSQLVTHSFTASRTGDEGTGEKVSPPNRFRHSIAGVDQLSAQRRSSEPEVNRLVLRPKPSQTVPSHAHSRSIDASFRFDEQIENAKLIAENAYLIEEIDRLKAEMNDHRREIQQERDRMRRDVARAEETSRKAEQDLKILRDSRGKVLRGLNTQTEITLVQFRRDFENLKKQLQAKDEIIAMQERRMASLVESNCTLRSGLQELQALPKHEDSDSDELDEQEYQEQLRLIQNPGAIGGAGRAGGGKGVVTNGVHGNPHESSDLLQVISQLDSGRFDSA